MDRSITNILYSNPVYLEYLRYHPKWYPILEHEPYVFKDFEKQLKADLKITTADKIEHFRKQVEFVNSLIKYLNNN